MTDDLDNLRPEVADAVSALDETTCLTNPGLKWYATIRAELLRLANELDSLKNLQSELAAQVVRVEKAEAELVTLKARLADAPVASVRVDDRMHVSIGARSNAVDFVPLHTKRVRLVVEE